MNQAQIAFSQAGETVAKRLEAKAQYIREMLAQNDLTAIERTMEIVAECDGTGAHSLKVLIRRAVLADLSPLNEIE